MEETTFPFLIPVFYPLPYILRRGGNELSRVPGHNGREEGGNHRIKGMENVKILVSMGAV